MKHAKLILLFTILPLVVACSTGEEAGSGSERAAEAATNQTNQEFAEAEHEADDGDETAARPAGWTEESHSNDAGPNYGVVFAQDEVKQMEITIAPEDWEAMQANMRDLFGEPGTGDGPGGFGGGGPGGFGPRGDGEVPDGFEPPQGWEPPAEGELPDGFEPPQGEPFDDRGRPGFGGNFTTENPMWVEATIEFEGQTWSHVGLRYKGNSSLQSAWRSGEMKMPLKLDFDEFEDDYPAIDDQRFYGFKQLSLANGFGDETYMRDTITYDLLEEAGLAAAETAYYEIVLDYGEGPVNLGLYTMIEVIDDTVIERFFGEDEGNIYEGDGPAASLAQGTFEQIESSFQKENNEDEADYGDIEALYGALHSQQRTSDPAAWRANLEAVFDVDSFLEWLALSGVLQHWDTYGSMTHNYYLYNDAGRLTWISWDHNLVLGGVPGGGADNQAPEGAAAARGRDGGFMGGRGNVSLDRANVGDSWPLIRYLLDDAIYYQAYVDDVAQAADLFSPDKMAARYEELAALIGPYARAEDDAASFENAVQQLTALTYARHEEALAFVQSQQ